MQSVTALTYRPRLFLSLAIVAFTIAVSAAGFWKYANYRYQGLDLAIYTNVLWNLSDGNGWYSSIQANSYLGDHVEPILLFLVPFFRLWSDPRLLIILQALAIGLTAVPLFLLFSNISSSRAVRDSSTSSRDRLREAERSPDDRSEISPLRSPPAHSGRNDEGRNEIARARTEVFGFGNWKLFGIWDLGFGISILWLLNPLLWNAALFEFHALAFAPLLLLSAALAYQRRRFWWFLFFLLLALTVREDIALIVVMFSVVAVTDRWHDTTDSSPPQQRGSERGSAWIITPLLLAIAWFFLASRITAAHNLAGHYKYLVYYGWIGDTPWAIIAGIFSHPLRILRHLLTLGNLDMILGLTMPFLFLPLLHRSRWLLLLMPPLLQVVLSANGGSNLIVEMHYALLFVPALALATIDAIAALRPAVQSEALHTAGLRAGVRPWWRRMLAVRFPAFPRPAAMLLTGVWIIGVAWAIGPFPGIARILLRGASLEDRTRRAAYDEMLARVPPDAAVAASYAALPHVAARREVASMSSAYLGVTQFGERSYALPEATSVLIMDARDAGTYAAQFTPIAWAAPFAAGGAERLRTLLAARGFGVLVERDGVALLARLDFSEQHLGGLTRGASVALDERYLVAPPDAARGRLVIDDLRDTTVAPPH